MYFLFGNHTRIHISCAYSTRIKDVTSRPRLASAVISARRCNNKHQLTNRSMETKLPSSIQLSKCKPNHPKIQINRFSAAQTPDFCLCVCVVCCLLFVFGAPVDHQTEPLSVDFRHLEEMYTSTCPPMIPNPAPPKRHRSVRILRIQEVLVVSYCRNAKQPNEFLAKRRNTIQISDIYCNQGIINAELKNGTASQQSGINK